ncbi:Nn.00g038220.m01.CDS01 [Neocucurbitaria sp. VM-36]
MEPRISTLLDNSCQERTTHDLESLVNPSHSAQRPQPVEPPSVGEDALMLANAFPSDYTPKHHNNTQLQSHVSSARPNAGAPIAQVLNNETLMLQTPQHGTTVPLSSTIPIDSRLDEYLLDSPDQVNKRSQGEHHPIQPTLGGSESSVIKLPKLPQLPRKTARRPRIPPLLQGLHQPPPLPPEGQLFPPITSEKNTFASDRGKRVGLDVYAEETRGKAEKEHINLGVSVTGASRDAQNADSTRVHHVAHEISPSKRVLDPEDSNKSLNKETSAQAGTQVRRNKKRNKWSEQETKNLLVGVSKFGIGNWKRILHDPDLDFNGRTAVDCKSNLAYFLYAHLSDTLIWTMKDRFRVCCPGAGLKTRKSKGSEASPKQHSGPQSLTPQTIRASETTGRDGVCIDTSVADQCVMNQQPGLVHCRAELAELGVRGPFIKNTRRPRRKFSTYDDKNLLIGFEKYGPVWHAMRDDTELGFDTRHPTDLRDRFRIKYPEKYAKAGYKLKPKEERIVEEKTRKDRGQDPSALQHSGKSAAQTSYGVENEAQPKLDAGRDLGKSGLTPTTGSYVPSNSSLRSFGVRQYLSDPLPILSIDDSVMEDGDGEESPITLNRNILRWADANPSSLSAFSPPPAAPTHETSIVTGDMPLHVFVVNDGIHINPLATLKLPPTTFYSNTLPIANSRPSNSTASLFKQSTTTSGASNTPAETRPSSNSTVAPAYPANTVPATSSFIAPPLTPNLPTIVYPHVPAASARTTVHNLPAPADLLLGVDLEKNESQTFGVMLDDVLNLAT